MHPDGGPFNKTASLTRAPLPAYLLLCNVSFFPHFWDISTCKWLPLEIMLPFPWFVEKLLPIRFFLTQQRSQISKTKNKSLVSKTVIVNTSLLSPFPSLVNQVLLQLLGWDILVQYITICYLDKYIWQFGQISFTIWTNTFCNLDKYNVQFGQIYFTLYSFPSLVNHVSHNSWDEIYRSNIWELAIWKKLQFGQICFTILTSAFLSLTNTWYNLDK